MMARFQVNAVFEIESRDLLVLMGQITEGGVRAGMTVSATPHSACLTSIELVRSQGGGEIALCLKLPASERESWRRLDLPGRTIIVQ